jgi:transcriptional regulator with XRE-family HTH domain
MSANETFARSPGATRARSRLGSTRPTWRPLNSELFDILITMAEPHTPMGNGLGGIVTRRRRELGLSMREAARRIGISPSYLAALEHGRNPTTGRAPVPSPPILGAIGRVLDIDLATLLDVSGAPASPSTHLLLYQVGAGYDSPLEAARRLYAGQVDAWIEIVDPRRSDETESLQDDVLVTKREPLISGRVFESARALGALSDVLTEVPRPRPLRRLGIVFGANSALLRSVENTPVLLGSEATWEEDVESLFRAALGVQPVANVCVYREADIEELATRLDPLATAVSLIQTHPHVAVQEPGGTVTIGPAAVEAILAALRPAGVSSHTWDVLMRAAAVGFARAATVARPEQEGDA